MQPNFSCCASYEKCDYGRLECPFKLTEPDKLKRCNCYTRHHTGEQENPFSESQKSTLNNNKAANNDQEVSQLEQLSLF